MITKKQAATLKRYAEQMVRAGVDHSWRGAQHPYDVQLIEASYKQAKQRYMNYLAKLTEKGL